MRREQHASFLPSLHPVSPADTLGGANNGTVRALLGARYRREIETAAAEVDGVCKCVCLGKMTRSRRKTEDRLEDSKQTKPRLSSLLSSPLSGRVDAETKRISVTPSLDRSLTNSKNGKKEFAKIKLRKMKND